MISEVWYPAPAKINLTLHVTGQRPDGYHLLDSLVVFADVGDNLALNDAGSLSLTVSGPFAQGVPTDARNLVWRAAVAAGWSGEIHLQKNLPHAAGIGSGSSDAACMLRIVEPRSYPVALEAELDLGADVPVCRVGKAARMRGIGERVSPVKLPPLPALLVNPGVAVSTASVFTDMQSKENPSMPEVIPGFDGVQDCAEWLGWLRNDLEAPAISQAPEIDSVLRELRSTRDVILARMSGSGATCFALYPTMKAAHFAAYEIGAAHPEWWCVATELT